MTKQENIISIVSEAVEKAWEGSSSAKEASEKYLVMLQQDDVLREEATRRHLERIAYLDVVAQPRGYRARLKRAAHQVVLSKGETSTPAVSLKNMHPHMPRICLSVGCCRIPASVWAMQQARILSKRLCTRHPAASTMRGSAASILPSRPASLMIKSSEMFGTSAKSKLSMSRLW